MNEFVQECRREWKRLGVPDPVAAEMAADLAADLEEAKAEGASAEAVLGSAAFDPHAFASAWATERGIVRQRNRHGDGLRRRAWMPAAVAAFALVAIVGAVLTINASSPTDRQFPAGFPPPPVAVEAPVVIAPDPGRIWIRRVDAEDSRDVAGTAGSILLIVSLGGILLLTASWFWLARRPRVDERPRGVAY